MKHNLFTQIKAALFMSIASHLLVGCAAYDESFDCPAGKGIGCQSVTEVKKKLNQGAIDMPETTTEAAARCGGKTPFLPPIVSHGQGKIDFADQTAGIDPVVFIDSHGMTLSRAREHPLRVWIAPYQDSDGNFHEASIVHTVIRPGYWHIQPNT